MKKKAIVADEDYFFKTGMDFLLVMMGMEVEHARTWPAANNAVLSSGADLLVLGGQLGGGPILDLIDMAEKAGRPKVLFAVGPGEQRLGARAARRFRCSVIDRMTYNGDFGRVVTETLAGKRHVAETIKARAERLDHDGGDRVTQLSNRELELLPLLATNKTAKEIAAAMGITTDSLKIYKKRMQSKLGVKKSKQLMLFSFHWMAQERKGFDWMDF